MSKTLIEPAAPSASPPEPPSPLLISPRGDAPIRAELYGLEYLEAHAIRLAAVCTLAPFKKVGSPLLDQFARNETYLGKTHERIAGAEGVQEGLGHDAEWFADNFHILQEVLREVRRDLPRGYDQELPKLASPPLSGYPRVYALALSLIAHTDSEVDETRLTRFVRAFQGVSPLTIGELWALPTMLRLVLLENLRRLASQMIWGWDERRRADVWAAEAFADPEIEPDVSAPVVAGRRRHAPPPDLVDPTDPFVVCLLQLLRDQGPRAAEALGRLESELEARGVDANDVLQREHRRQASNQVTVGNCVISLRLLSALDWNAFFERNSVVESILRGDPGDVYSQQDFATRDSYRKAIEKIARGSNIEETAVAVRAVALARAGRGQGAARGHVGYYLVDRGHPTLKAEFKTRTPWRDRLHGWTLRHPRTTYFGPIAAVLALVLSIPVGLVLGSGAPAWWVPIVLLVSLLPAGELAVGLVNHFLTLLMPPKVLPKLDFKDGIPADYAAFVVMPSMLVRPNSAADLLERLEIHYLANPDPRLRFALLTDFADAPAETMPEDAGYVRDALVRVKELNERYGGGSDKFYLFHRKRLYNPAQRCWMGWERKRGKLSEFNRMLRGDTETSYSVVTATPETLPRLRYVITLDSDTKMTRDTAGRLIGAIAHPLNQARFDPSIGRVVEGYGVLQPRVSFHLSAATHSRFAALLASSGGIDPYSSAASDTYMDLFGIGSFTGKGVYDVDAFEAATGHTFPENQILSHDLIEGNYARCGLLSDTELFDDFPARYHAYARREHRWVRGDWQILPWLGRRVPSPHGSKPNPLPTLERWKILDNLRRSLVPPSIVLMLALGWTVLPGNPWFWTIFGFCVLAIPLFQLVIGTVFGCLRGGSLDGLKRLPDSLPPTVAQVLLSLVFLANQSRLLVDAIVRTLGRLFLTHKNLLEWETAASTETRLGNRLARFALSMWPAMAIAAVLASLVTLLRPEALAASAPILLAWFISPVIAYWVSQPRPTTDVPLNEAERRALRRVARKTWYFFETFVGEDDHWLPPDNFQELPDGRVAHRTSPTNQGLLLLSTLAAHDLGYVSLRNLADRLEKTLDTFDRMEKHWGHFYNWYNTRTLRVLPPAYVSTVDSGNLLGCLVTLKQGLREKIDGPIVGPELIEGVADTLALAVAEGRPGREAFDALLIQRPGDLLAWDDWLGRVDWDVTTLVGRLRSPEEGQTAAEDDREAWAKRLGGQVRARRAELAAVAPWLAPLRSWEEPIPPNWGSTDLAQRWAELRGQLVDPGLSLAGLDRRAAGLTEALETIATSAPAADRFRAIIDGLQTSIAPDLLGQIRRLADRAEAIASAMDFRPLYKADRHLYSIGCNLTQGSLDGACYDLLASESSLTSFLTVARGDAPRRHWFQLGRPFIRGAGRIGLVSWGGTMFEYLMPRLLLRSLPGTLVSEACRTAVSRQVEYGRQKGLPWGISESAFNAQYVDGDYQYQAFGVPGLGLKRGLERDLVIAPYATAMAAMVAPREALENLKRLTEAGGEGSYGYYEAIDYTPDRVPKGSKCVVVRSYMAHHQGMTLVGLTNAVLDDPMPRRFHAVPMVRAVDLLLQERVPRDAPTVDPAEVATAADAQPARSTAPLLSRQLTTPSTPAPRTLLLSNTQYHVLLTNAGSGVSTWRGLDVTRWREDATRDCWGQYCYVRDPEHDLVWSAGHQPVCRPTDDYEVIFAADKATFRRRDAGIETLLEVTVSPEQFAEVRRVTVTNLTDRPRELELTSYAEVVLAPRGADLAHPAFGKLFLETEWIAGPAALLCRRRPRSADQAPVWAVHVAATETQAAVGATPRYETDRSRFLGRGRSTADPAALDRGASLSGTTGPVLDPVLSLRVRVHLEPGTSSVVAFTTAVAESRDEALALADQYREPAAAARAFELAWAHSQIEHSHRGWSPEEAHLFQRLGAHVIFAGSAQRPTPALVASNRHGQADLWRYGISGDRPVVLVRIGAIGQVFLARQLLLAHAFLRLKGLEFDLVLLNEETTSYFEELNEQLQEAVRTAGAADLVDKAGGVFVRKAEQMPEQDKTLIQAAARVVLVGDRGSLASQLDRLERVPALPPPLVPSRPAGFPAVEPLEFPEGLLYPNGLGGFREDSREYCILVKGEGHSGVGRNGSVGRPTGPKPHPVLPPAPWINVIANPSFGFLITEAGSGFTWSGNSQANRLTPWSNDPVSDPPGEVVYLRDEETGDFWSPTPLPVPSAEPTLVRHGQGYTIFERNTHGLQHELTLLVPPDDTIKRISLKVTNPDSRARRLSATFYAEWVLGSTRDAAAMHVVSELDTETGAIFARNVFRTDFASRIAFADVDTPDRTVTADRAAFLGRHGSVASPAALGRIDLSGRVGAVLDPCAAIQVKFDLEPGQSREIVFFLGEAGSVDEARALLFKHREASQSARTLDEVKTHWEPIVESVRVQTPDPAFDLLLNRWLVYQILSCRVLGRSAFYQSGGAFGYRDQLQDVQALVHAAPEVARAHILLAASRQFTEGDVQHWWHPPSGRGVRTRISDDPLWLVTAACRYAQTTGDASIFEERVNFLKAPMLRPGQEDDFSLPAIADEPATLYEHCALALERSLRFGAHGLPLMGTGDWNDGMNRVGAGGKGESVWLAWFLLTVLGEFTPLAESRGETDRVHRFRAASASLAACVEANAWDGAWYRRAYFDDGRPLGSASNDECRIDSITQSWAVISGSGDPERARIALASVDDRLVREHDALILLLDPPFDSAPMEPGYIKGYLPGTRENGGQYTHAAAWVVLANARLGRGRRAFDLFQLLNPVRHSATSAGVERYRVEPYVVAADVYGRSPHVGRGGWTWYTGSASWLYRVGLEALIGLTRVGQALDLDPCIPGDWPGFAITYRYRSATYRIRVENPNGVERGIASIEVDGLAQAGTSFPIHDDGQIHEVRAIMGTP